MSVRIPLSEGWSKMVEAAEEAMEFEVEEGDRDEERNERCIPISACARAMASLVPSPMKSTVFFLFVFPFGDASCKVLIYSAFDAGVQRASTFSAGMLSCEATEETATKWSPEVRETDIPRALSEVSTERASGRSWSERPYRAMSSFSRVMQTSVLPVEARDWTEGYEERLSQYWFPAQTWRPSCVPLIPEPGMDVMDERCVGWIPFASKCLAMAMETGCLLLFVKPRITGRSDDSAVKYCSCITDG